MTEHNGLILGFDPGGEGGAKSQGGFGWSICICSNGKLQPDPKTGLAKNAWDAFLQVNKWLECHNPTEKVLAAGIDAPMFWNREGKRTVDDVLRNQLKANGFPSSKLGGTVQQVNSLQGACLVQGALMGNHLHKRWALPLTEAHPTALHHLLGCLSEPEQKNMVQNLTAGLVDHELDATLSAVAAWAMIHEPNGWRNLYDEESCPIRPLGTPVGYWMPNP